jgi:hypothetical protein
MTIDMRELDHLIQTYLSMHGAETMDYLLILSDPEAPDSQVATCMTPPQAIVELNGTAEAFMAQLGRMTQ